MSMRIGFLALVAAAACVIAGPKLAPAADAPAPATTEIHLSQQASATLPRDRLRAQLRVEIKGGDPAAIQGAVNKRMAAALAHADKVASVKAVTGAYSVYRTGGGNQPEAWEASQSLVLTAKDVAPLLRLAGDLQKDGLLMSGLSFELAPETLVAIQSKLTAEALAGLRARASEIAKDLGMKVERYREIDVGNAAERGGPMPMAMGLARAGGAPPPEARAGDVTVTLTVEARVILAPGHL